MKRRSAGPGSRLLAVLLAAIMASASLAGCVQYATVPPITSLSALSPTPLSTAIPAQSTGETDPSDSWILLSSEENGYAHLFGFSLVSSSLTRLTFGEWDDIDPCISPDGTSIAFASNRHGFWDLFTMDLRTARITQLTDTPAYDGSPMWSPDMAWMAYETYNDGQLDIAILSLTDPAAAAVLLTDDPASDHSPAWSPDGRKIAFVSSRSGDADIWLADLDQSSERFVNLSLTPGAAESHPAWSRDGSRLAWAVAMHYPGSSGLYIWDASRPGVSATWSGAGTWPAWNPDGTAIAAAVAAPTQQLLSAYALTGTPLILPAPLPGLVRGLNWPAAALPDPLPPEVLEAAQAAALESPAVTATTLPEILPGRWHIVPLEGVQARSSGLHALAEPAFTALRDRLIADTGWDPLASLENAYVPFTTTLDPGLEQDWLYTGRAFAINTLMLNAGWMSVLREDIGSQTFWRVFIRVQKQDGSQGAPLKDPPWDLNTRYQLDPRAYEAGGSYTPVPSGYWVDLTSIAEVYGWHRLAALPGWRTYYAGARFSEFAFTSGLDWYSAMLELYPAEALYTATPVLPPTVTPSRTPRPTLTPTPTWTPRATLTPSATYTPSITPTPPPPSNTPPPTPTPPTIIPTFPSATP